MAFGSHLHGRYTHEPVINVAADGRDTGASFILRCDEIMNLPDGHAIRLLFLSIEEAHGGLEPVHVKLAVFLLELHQLGEISKSSNERRGSSH